MTIRIFASLPAIEPIVPTARPQPFNDPAWLFEPKYDGFRGMLYVTRQSCTLYSQRGNAMTRFRGFSRSGGAILWFQGGPLKILQSTALCRPGKRTPLAQPSDRLQMLAFEAELAHLPLVFESP
jgi:hypothetical protein